MVDVELHNLGHVEIHRGNIEAAERYFAECAELGTHDDAYAVAMTHLNRAAVAFARGQEDQAGAALAEAGSILEGTEFDPPPDDQLDLDWLHGRLADASGGVG